MISILWDCASSLWVHCNGILHGHTIKETESRELEALQLQITTAYDEYSKDTFIIPNHQRFLFTSRSLQHRLKMGIDSKKCWLRSVWEAKQLKKSQITDTQQQQKISLPLKVIKQNLQVTHQIQQIQHNPKRMKLQIRKIVFLPIKIQQIVPEVLILLQLKPPHLIVSNH
jgi:hypothetical protein